MSMKFSLSWIFFQELLEVKGKLLFIEDAEGLRDDDGRNEYYAFAALTGGE